MSGHVDFGHHRDAALFGVGNHFADFVVGVEFALVATFPMILRVIELRIHLALDAPCGIVGQVPMEIVQLVETHQVDGFLQHTDGLIVASRIVHKAPKRVARPVVNFTIRDFAVFVQQLGQGALCPSLVARHHRTTFFYNEKILVGIGEIGFGVGFHLAQLMFFVAK